MFEKIKAWNKAKQISFLEENIQLTRKRLAILHNDLERPGPAHLSDDARVGLRRVTERLLAEDQQHLLDLETRLLEETGGKS